MAREKFVLEILNTLNPSPLSIDLLKNLYGAAN